jgi:integrase
MRDCPLSVLSAAHIKMLRDRKAAKPGAANNRRKYLSSMFGWAVEHGLLRLNPAREVRRIRYATAGFHTWTVEEVRQFEQQYAIGTKARLALALLLFLGPRRGDVVTLGRQHERNGWLRFVPQKTRYKRLETHPADSGRLHRAQPDGRPHIPCYRQREALHCGGIR